MRARDEAQWSQQCKVFQESGETGKQFQNYLDFWCTTSEKMMEEGVPLRQAFQEALKLTEHEVGCLDASAFLGQMIALIISNWHYGAEMAQDLTAIELKLVTSAVQEHTAELQNMAEANSSSPG